MATLILIIIPVLFALLVLVANKNMSKYLSVAGASSSLILTLIILYLFKSSNGSSQLLAWHAEWLPQIGADFYTKVDGLNVVMILLTALVTPFIFLSVNKEKSYYSDKLFYVLMLLMQSAIFGVFIAKNLFLFYIFWELALIPIFFIVLLYGAENRQKITFNFFVYTLMGSLFMLIAIIYLGTKTSASNFNVEQIYFVAKSLSLNEQYFLFACFFLAFAIKIPIFPFHTWQPNTYVVAPTQGTMMLSALMLKMGLFGLIFWLIPIAPLAWQKLSFFLILLAAISTIYGGLMAFIQKNFKRLLAYSSMAHVGLIAAGIFAFNLASLQGAIIQMLAHSINAVAMFYIYDIIQTRTQIDEIKKLGGIRAKNTLFSVFFIILLMDSIALPLSISFIGEFSLLYGIFQFNYFLAGFAGLSIVLGTTYMVVAYHRMMHGQTSEAAQNFKALNTSEIFILSALSVLVILFGVFPNIILNLTESDAIHLIEHVKTILNK
ncbi:MAG TPA: NADH-quinone oxidoreductase subunit M [Chitinophagales bacterium]|nr:NADH-quinone oxidoreductase subunit M [Chitinophagales bacterium]